MVKLYGLELFCHRKIASAKIIQTQTLLQIIKGFDKDQKRAIMLWLTRTGPFWDDERRHGPDDYMICQDQVVTDSAVGEAAWCCMNGIDRSLVSFSPSAWEIPILPVDFYEAEKPTGIVDVQNFWELTTLETLFEKMPVLPDSWDRLRDMAELRFEHLFFLKDAFAPLKGHPFVRGAAQRLMALFQILNQFNACHDDQGVRTKEAIATNNGWRKICL